MLQHALLPTTHKQTRHPPEAHHQSFKPCVCSPDGAAGAVRVHSSNSTNPSTDWRIFVHIHEVVIRGEDWRLVHITDDDSHSSGILEWSQVRETSVHVHVGGFDVECVDFPLLIVEALQRLHKEEQ